MNWKRYLISILVAWGGLECAGLVHALIHNSGPSHLFSPVAVLANLMLLASLAIVIFLPIFLLAQRFLVKPEHSARSVVIGVIVGVVAICLWNAVNSIPKSLSQYIIEVVVAAAVGAILGRGFETSRLKSEHQNGH
jgi:drug/metabolite transporter (DMT)-like permease